MDESDYLEMLLRADSLKQIHRTGWDIAGILYGRKESVAEHSWGVSLVAWVIASDLSDKGDAVDLAKVLSMAIHHDLSESLTADIPRKAVQLGGDSLKIGKAKAESTAVEHLFSGTNLLTDSMQLHNELKSAKSLESRIVLVSDTLDMLLRAISLERNGVDSKMLDSFFSSSINRLDSYKIELASKIGKLLYEEHSSNLP
jgi:putative hydrolase of HD superfamily